MSHLKKFLAVFGTACFVFAFSASSLKAASNATTTSSTATPDDYRVNYFLGLKAPGGTGNDATLTILDPGSNGSASLCANIYVLNPSEEMEACCATSLTPDEIVTGYVVEDLTTNLLNGTSFNLSNGVIKIIASAPGSHGCDAGAPGAPTPSLVAWLTRVDYAGTAYGVTTTEFAYAALSTAEEASLVNRCENIELYGSGYGKCTPPAEPANH
jgi:hypothetical protein